MGVAASYPPTTAACDLAPINSRARRQAAGRCEKKGGKFVPKKMTTREWNTNHSDSGHAFDRDSIRLA